jgi:phosphatidate cytidylyltransferase
MLKSRILTALVLAAVIVGVLLYMPAGVTLVLLALAILLGAWEWSAFIRGAGRGLRLCYVAVVAALLAVAFDYCSDRPALRLFLGAATVWWCVALLWLTLMPQRMSPWAAALSGAFALVPAGVALGQLRVGSPDGGAWMLFALFLIVAADTGAFFAGHRFGRVKLAPRVSPGKTWEGVIGGMLLALLAALGGAALFGQPLLAFAAVGLATAAFSVVGDLTESMLKRSAGVKDSGHLLPGHGGMLDRLDSIAAGAPLFVFGLLLIGALP